MTETTTKTFPLGQIVATQGVMATVPHARRIECLARHARGDWGVISDEDEGLNDEALEQGNRILSVYSISPIQPSTNRKNRFWIITEADRSVTTLLLPDEY
jgi:hypothetical protein